MKNSHGSLLHAPLLFHLTVNPSAKRSVQEKLNLDIQSTSCAHGIDLDLVWKEQLKNICENRTERSRNILAGS